MKMYWSVFRIRFINILQYRAAVFASMITGFAWGFMEITAYNAFYRVDPSRFPMSLSQTVSYIWIQQAFLTLFMMLSWEIDMSLAITEGGIAYEMVRPMDLYNRWFVQATARRLSSTVLRFLPVLLLAFVLPEPYRLSLPPNVWQLLWFALSITLSLAVVVAFTMLIHISIFYTLSPSGLPFILAVLGDFLMGSIVPLPFFPEPFRTVAELLPFSAMSNIPLRINSGNIMGLDVYKSIALQLFWLAVLWMFGRFTMKCVLKKVVVQGG